MDVKRLDEVRAAVAAANDHFGRIDILVNNAGGGRMAAALDATEDDFDHIVTVNLKATFFASQAVAPLMIEQGGGRIVNIGSQAGFVALPDESLYCMAKAGVSHLTKCLAVEWGPHGILVNAVAPTFIATPGTEPALSDPAFRAQIVENIAALHRIGDPMDVAGAVVYLASPASALVTGTTLLVDGGWTAR
jgi:NAD(P)-dependent dehydrogenase (short-subunit alcohol dehydrogenase family)